MNENLEIENLFLLLNRFCDLIIFWPKLAKNFLFDDGRVIMKMVNEIEFTNYFMSGVCGSKFYKNVLIATDKNATCVLIGI